MNEVSLVVCFVLIVVAIVCDDRANDRVNAALAELRGHAAAVLASLDSLLVTLAEIDKRNQARLDKLAAEEKRKSTKAVDLEYTREP